MRRWWIACTALVLLACEKGLSPTGYEQTTPLVRFPVEPHGGNLIGLWHPAGENAFQVAFVDSSQITALVDSLILETELSGTFQFDPFGNYRIDATLSITPKVYVALFNQPLVLPAVPDTLIGSGLYHLFEKAGTIVLENLQTRTFSLDTLGYTVKFRPDGTRELELVSVPNTFPYPGFEWIEFYFVFHLEEESPPGLARSASHELNRERTFAN